MSSTRTYTAEEIAAEKVKHAVSLTKLDKELRFSAGIKKIPMKFTVAEVAAMLADGRAIQWEKNRAEVKSRAGGPDEYMLTLAARRSGGTFVCYMNGKCPVDAKGNVTPTKENPLVIYEGGHRSRWIKAFFNNEVQIIAGLDLTTLKQIHPETVTAIRNAFITFHVNTHESGSVPEEFVKKEYELINTKTEGFSVGEMVAASNDKIRNELQDLMADALGHKPGSKKRDMDQAELRALVNGALGQAMDKKEASLTGQEDPTELEVVQAKKVIDGIVEIERQLAALYVESAAQKKRLEARTLDFKMLSTIISGLVSTVSDETMTESISVVVDFYRQFFGDAKTWTKMKSEITGGSAGKHNNNKVFENRWLKLKNKMRPVAPPTAAVVGQVL